MNLPPSVPTTCCAIDAHRERAIAPWFAWEAEQVLRWVMRGDSVLELGAGGGALTVHLARRAGWVTAVETDPGALAVLRQTRLVACLENVTIEPHGLDVLAGQEHDVVVATDDIRVTDGVGYVESLLDRATRVVIATGWVDAGDSLPHVSPNARARFRTREGTRFIVALDPRGPGDVPLT